MSRLFRRYCCCSIFCVILVFIVYLRFYGRFFNDVIIDSDEFIAVAYITDDDDSGGRNDKFHWKENQLLNLNNFQYLIQPSKAICSNDDDEYLAVLLVTSYVGHDEVRSAHRTAITNAALRKFNVLRVFLLADIPAKEKFITQKAIESEHQHFNDIVQGNFVEAYRNLSYKHAMGLQWSSSHTCLRSKFIIKMDDDIVVDFYQLFNYLLMSEQRFDDQRKHQHFLSGYIFRNVVPIRKHQNKWFVSTDEFDGDVYPDYLSGWMYVTIPHTARVLVQTAFKESSKIFWIDDTWITGILRAKLNIPIDETLNKKFSANSEFLDCCIRDLMKYSFQCPFIAGPNGGDHNLIKTFIHTVHMQCYNESNDLASNRCTERSEKMPPLKKTCVGSDKHLLRESHGAAMINAIKL